MMDLEAHLWDRPDDPDRFARIWKRVMPEEREDCPIEIVKQPRPDPPPAGERPQRQPGPTHPMAPFLRQQIGGELQDWQDYLALSRRGNGVLRGIAAQELTHARRLSAAYFLLTGIRFLPMERARPRRMANRAAALRERFQAEREDEARYRQAARDAGGDETLRTLFLALAEEEAAHAAQIQQILERWRH